MINVAVIGCGNWGKNLIRNFSSLGNLSAIYCLDTISAKLIEKEFSVPFKSYEDILEDPSINAIVVATTTNSHFEISKKALLSNKHVFVEKPVSLNFEESKKLSDIANDKNLILMTGHLLQYHPAFIKVKELVKSGVIGSIKTIHTRRQFMGRIRQSENVMWDLIPHDMSMILSLTNEEPINITTNSSKSFGNCNDSVSAKLNFKSGIDAYLSVSWCFPEKEQKLFILGEKGTIVFDDTLPWDQKVKMTYVDIIKKDDDIFLIPGETKQIEINQGEPLKLECEHFIKCIENFKEPNTGQKEFLPVINVCQQIQNLI